HKPPRWQPRSTRSVRGGLCRWRSGAKPLQFDGQQTVLRGVLVRSRRGPPDRETARGLFPQRDRAEYEVSSSCKTSVSLAATAVRDRHLARCAFAKFATSSRDGDQFPNPRWPTSLHDPVPSWAASACLEN